MQTRQTSVGRIRAPFDAFACEQLRCLFGTAIDWCGPPSRALAGNLLQNIEAFVDDRLLPLNGKVE